MSRWDSLKMAQRAEVMRLAVQNGIYDLDTIRGAYNEFAKGGDKENQYSAGSLVNAIYKNNPREEFLGEPDHHYDFTQSEEWVNAHGYYPDSRGHRDDRVKKPSPPTHPSRGSFDGLFRFNMTDRGMENPNYTLFGMVDGGQDPQATLYYKDSIVLPEITVTPKGNYIFNPYDNIRIKFAEGGKADIHIKPENKGKFTALKERTGHSATWFKENGTPAQKKMATFALNASKWKHGFGGHIYDGTTEESQQMNRMGYVPSDAIRKRIEQYEGKAMTGALDPLSGRYARNNSYESEAMGFYNALPESIRERVLSNPELADNLYSYSYNVGAGNFKTRVVPALERYYAGTGSADDVASSMWASGDRKLRGLRLRREQEKSGVLNALRDQQVGELNQMIDNLRAAATEQPPVFMTYDLGELFPVVPASDVKESVQMPSEVELRRQQRDAERQERKEGEMLTYDEPQTFAGGIVGAFGASPKIVRGTDVLSSYAQMTPAGLFISALDLGRDLNRAYHKEDDSKKDVALDVLAMLPYLSKVGLKDPDTLINTIKASKARNIINGIFGSGRVGDFIDDTWGANKTSKALGGHIYGGTTEDSQQMNITVPYKADTKGLPPVFLNYPESDDDYGWTFIPTTLMKEIVVTASAPYRELPKASISDNAYLNTEYEQEIINNIKNGTKEQIEEVQRNLANAGRYDLNADNMTEQQIRSLQKKIGAKVDGIWGKESTQKWREYNIDGIFGKRALDALNKNRKNVFWERDVPTESTEWCAEWISKKVMDATGNNFGAYGDAWNMPKNIVASGGQELYNIYDESFQGITNTNSLKKKTEQAIKENPFDVKQLQVGDIVGIYMPSSDMHEVALKDGSTFNTHVGIVTGFNKNGIPIIEHNIHRKHHKDLATNITGSLSGQAKIATVSRPAYEEPHTPFSTENQESVYTSEKDSPLFKEFASSVAGSKELLQKLFPNIDADEVERVTLAVQGRETGFMKNKASDQTSIKSKATRFYRDRFKKKDPETVSSNLAKMKLSSFTSAERNLLGIHTPQDLENPTLAGRAAAYLLAKNYSYFKDMQDAYPNLGITEDDIRYLTALSYNQGMSKLRNIGFDKNGLPAPEELESIRAMAAEDAKIKDITSTNWSHLGKVGKLIYDIFGEEYTPYISAEESYRNKLINTANSKKQLTAINAYGGLLERAVEAQERSRASRQPLAFLLPL